NEFMVTTPTDSDASANAVDENSAPGTSVGVTANAFDSDATNNTVTYSLTNRSGERMSILQSTGEVVCGLLHIAREADAASISITVLYDSSDRSSKHSFPTRRSADLNEFMVTTPTDSDASANAVDENSAPGTSVGVTANAFDSDATNNTVTYSLTN